MKQILKKIKQRKITIFFTVIILFGLGFYAYGKIKDTSQTTTQYITTKPQKENISVTVSASGQVSASNQVDIKSSVASTITAIKVKAGDKIKKDDTLVILDARDAVQNLRDAQSSLQAAQLSLKKVKEPTDSLTLLQSENSLQSAKNTLEKLKLSQKTDYKKLLEDKKDAISSENKAYEDSFNKIADAFLDMPTIIGELYDSLYGTDIADNVSSISAGQSNSSALLSSLSAYPDKKDQLELFVSSAINDYQTARSKYDVNFTNYKNSSRYSSTSTIEQLLAETVETTKSLSQALKSQANMYDAWVDFRIQKQLGTFSTVTSIQSELSSNTSNINSHLSTLLSTQTSLKNSKDSLVDIDRQITESIINDPIDLASAQRTVTEKEASLKKLKEGPDELELLNAELSVRQKQNSLLAAQEKLSDYTIKAPFDGVIAQMDVKQGESLSSSAVIATIISQNQLATMSFNEVDVSKIKLNQKAVLNFDAIDQLSISGKVVEIDALGTVSQGVVSYNVTIAFDTQDTRIKPGMSVSASIIIDSKNDVLTISSSAVKTQGTTQYVQVKNGQEIISKNIVSGINNDTKTEIVSGLTENDEVITQTINSNTTGSNSTQSTNRNASSPTSNYGGMMRVMR